MKQLLGAGLALAAVGAAFVLHRAGPSRESLLPLSRAVAEHEKAADRALAAPFPLSADEERAIGERLASGMRTAESGPAEPGAALWRELGAQAAGAPLVARFRGRYEFRVVPGGPPNAFALPGGFVYATEELLASLRGDPDALLFVLGHEIAHVELRHCADGYRLRAEGRGPLRSVAGGVLSVGRFFAALHFSELQELEADRFAVRLIREQRADPRASLRALDALGLSADGATKRRAGQVLSEGLRDYFSTHPGSWERRAALEREARRSDG